jgi:DEAD/DEAH box helicase domain-containing protein
VKFYTLENVGAGNLSMPEQEMHTTAFWLHFPERWLARFPDLSPTQKLNGLVGMGNAMRAIATLLLMCDPRDLGVTVTENIPGGVARFEPNLYLYDTYPGGIGQSAPLFQLRRRLLEGSAQLIASCPCEAGCPSCVGPAGNTGEGAKAAAQRMLAALL